MSRTVGDMMMALSAHVERAHAFVDLLYNHLDERPTTDRATRLVLDSIGSFLGDAEDEIARFGQNDAVTKMEVR